MSNIKALIEKTKHLKVLFAEDDEDIRNSFETFLTKFFDTFYTAEDGEEGLEYFKNNPTIDVIITDILMPKLNGIDMIKAIKKINPNVYIIVITATDDEETEEDGLYNLKIHKPIMFEDMEHIIESISSL